MAPGGLARELRRWVADGVPEFAGLPEDQVALVSLAAARVAPTILAVAGKDPDDEELAGLVEGVLLTAWANSLIALDAEALDRLRAEAGNSAT